jgi:hypothetical protein
MPTKPTTIDNTLGARMIESLLSGPTSEDEIVSLTPYHGLLNLTESCMSPRCLQNCAWESTPTMLKYLGSQTPAQD